MQIIKNNVTDPYFNLASEEYLLDGACDGIFMLWRNDRSVIIGRNQNAYSELNIPFINENKIKVVRRLSGGGAVFHDPGNVNFTFILPREECGVLDFAFFTKPIINALSQLGIDAGLSGRNDILANGRKVSGNAQCTRNGKTMHHGTLLFDADIGSLSGALTVNAEKMKAKGVKSVTGRVANIADMTEKKMSTQQFMDYLELYMEEELKCAIRGFSEDETGDIERLSAAKYSTWEWNFGSSKEFTRTKERYFPAGLLQAALNADHGRISDIGITGDFFGTADISVLERRLVGTPLKYEDLAGKLTDIGDFIAGISADDLINLIL